MNKVLLAVGLVGGSLALGVVLLSRHPTTDQSAAAVPSVRGGGSDQPSKTLDQPSVLIRTNEEVGTDSILAASQVGGLQEPGDDGNSQRPLVRRGQRTPEHWRDTLDSEYKRLEFEREMGGPGIFARALVVDQTSILAILDLAGRYETVMEGEEMHLNDAPPGEHWVASGHALYRVPSVEFPGFVELSRLAARPPVDPDPSLLAQANTQVDQRYSQAKALIAEYLKE